MDRKIIARGESWLKGDRCWRQALRNNYQFPPLALVPVPTATADLLGLSDRMPPFAKSYANLRFIITQAVQYLALHIEGMIAAKLKKWLMANG